LHRELGGVGTDFVTALDAYGHTRQALGKEGEATDAWREAAVLAESQADPRAAQLCERAGLAGGLRLPEDIGQPAPPAGRNGVCPDES